MAYLEKTISFLLLATTVLFLVTVLSATVSSNIYFAEITSSLSRYHLRAGMWGVCARGFWGLNNTGVNGCTKSQGGYSVGADIMLASTQLGQAPQYAYLWLLKVKDTGPLVCFLVSFLLVTIAMLGPWGYEIFGHKQSALATARPITTGLVVLSCILSWVGFAFSARMATTLQVPLDEYNSRTDARERLKASKGNAVWIGLVGCILSTIISVLLFVRWRQIVREKEVDGNRKSMKEVETTA